MKRFCKILFSRYTICAIFILLEIVVLPIAVIYGLDVYLILIGGAVISVTVTVSIINREENPEYKASWIMIIMLVPYLGSLYYLLFSHRRMSKKEARIFSEILPIVSARRRRTSQGEHMSSLKQLDGLAATKARAILNDDYFAELTRNTKSEYYPDGALMYSAMLDALRAAQRFIFIEYFIIEDGEMWRGIYEVLCERAMAGVEVRVLFDDVGCIGKLPLGFEEELKRRGISAAAFGKITPTAAAVHNNRDHRKLMIIDGVTAFTGGINIADEYIGKRERFGIWRDGGIRLVGDAVLPMTEQFLCSWDITSGGVSDYGKYTVGGDVKGDGGYYIPFGSGPSPIYRRPVGKNVFLNIINQAEKYVYITTPYLIIDFDLTEALRCAALRGVSIRIITPGIADKKIVKIMTKSSYRYLIDAGVEIYEYTPGFIHEKLLVSDGKYAVVGTINFDYRSLVHHYENAVFMAYTDTVKKAHDGFIKNVAESCRIERSAARLSLIEKIFKIGIRVFAPLL